jgi:heterodisulfide reductase subunit A-like polyferredoxin
MRSLLSSAAFALFCARSALSLSHPDEKSSFKPNDIIIRDVAIIGGGASGTHAAISLKDKGKSIIVIEKQGRLGGHTETYIDPSTGIPIDYGVRVCKSYSCSLHF